MTAPARLPMRSLLQVFLPLLLLFFLFGCGSPNDPTDEGEGYTLISTYKTRGHARDVAVDGNTIYVSENNYGISRMDVSNPANPVVTDHYITPQAPRLLRVAPWNNLLIAVYSDGLQGFLLGDTLGTDRLVFGSGSVYDLELFPDTLTTLSLWDNQQHFTEGTRALRCDLNDGMHATYVFPDSGKLTSGERDTLKHFSVIDPFEIDLYGNGVRAVCSIDGYHLVGVAAGDNGIAIAEMDEGVDSDCGRWLSDIDTPGDARELVHHDGYLYVADMIGGLAIIDIRTPTNPQYVTSWKPSGLDHARNIEVDDNRLALVDEYDGVYFLDISVPSKPVLKAHFDIREVNSVRFLEDGTAIVASNKEGLSFLRLDF